MMTNAEETVRKAIAFASDPIAYFDCSPTKMHSVPREELEALQLEALKYRFARCYDTVPMVKKLADEQHFAGIDKLEDVVPMLFEHTMYKSYPKSLLEKGRFQQLTRWLDKLTAIDLSGIDASACESVGEWIQLLDDETPLRVATSSGTSGIMSFNPKTQSDYDLEGKATVTGYMYDFGGRAPDPDNLVPGYHVVAPTYRYGATGFVRVIEGICKKWIAGSEDRVHTLYPGKQDVDVLLLAARIRAAKTKGTLDKLKISPALLARQKEFEQQQKDMAKDLEVFYERIINELAGERVYIMTPWSQVYDLSLNGLKRGLKSVFSPESVVIAAGGTKGMERPDDWQEPVCEFTGVSKLIGGYGMSELTGLHRQCEHGNYHLTPWSVTFLLDPDTSELLPRTGVVTGRAAFFDLMLGTHWGGFISGDEITVHWNGDCPCGRTSAYVEDNVTRYSEKRGGDDKISCAATAEAHEEAMNFLTRFEDA